MNDKERIIQLVAEDTGLLPSVVKACLESAAAPNLLAETWDKAIQLADDEGCLLYHQAKGLRAANPYGPTT